MPIPMAQVLRLYIQMFLSYGLYVCIILETAHHKTTLGIFCNITQKTTPEENSHKMLHISSLLYFLLWKGQGCFWDKDQISLLSEIQTLSHKLMVRQTFNHHHFDQHAEKPISKDFQVISSSSSWSKKLCVFLRKKYGCQIGNAWKNIKSYQQAPSLPLESKYISLKQIG